jgi:hypothetical protein
MSTTIRWLISFASRQKMSRRDGPSVDSVPFVTKRGVKNQNEPDDFVSSPYVSASAKLNKFELGRHFFHERWGDRVLSSLSQCPSSVLPGTYKRFVDQMVSQVGVVEVVVAPTGPILCSWSP